MLRLPRQLGVVLVPSLTPRPAHYSSASPSARPGSMFGNSQMSFVGTPEGGTDPLLQLLGGEQARRFDHLALAVHPLGLDGIQPGALDRQRADHDPHAATLLLH